MRKSFITSLTLSAIFLVTLIVPLVQAYPMSYPTTDDACICDHYLNEAYINTQYDEYTGTGLTGVYSNPSTIPLFDGGSIEALVVTA